MLFRSTNIQDKHLITAAGSLLLAHNAQHSTSLYGPWLKGIPTTSCVFVCITPLFRCPLQTIGQLLSCVFWLVYSHEYCDGAVNCTVLHSRAPYPPSIYWLFALCGYISFARCSRRKDDNIYIVAASRKPQGVFNELFARPTHCMM